MTSRTTSKRSLLACSLVLAACLLLAPAQSQADPYLFDSVCTIDFDQEVGGVFYYNMSLTSLDVPTGAYRELYIVMDRSYVVLGDGPSLPADVHFISAEVISEPGIDLFFSSDMRSFANMNSSAWLDDHRMDLYDPATVDALADACYFVEMSLGVNRELTLDEMYNFGYWAGDLRGTKIEGAPFTESDGGPVPEPGTLLLALLGGAGLVSRKVFRL